MKRARVVVVAALLAVAWTAARPARADCVTGELVVHRSGQTSITVLPAGTCVVPTPWPRNGGVGGGHTQAGIPTGVPNGGYAWVGLVFP